MASRLANLPIIIACLGGEMVYLLDERLCATGIKPDKRMEGEEIAPPHPSALGLEISSCLESAVLGRQIPLAAIFKIFLHILGTVIFC